MSIPFYDFPSSPILIIGALGIAVAIAVFVVAYQKYFNSPLNKEVAEKKKALINERKVLNEKLEKIEQDLKNLWNQQFKSQNFLNIFFLTIPYWSRIQDLNFFNKNYGL